MKKNILNNLYLKVALLLLTLSATLSGCSKQDVEPQDLKAAVQAPEAVITGYMVKTYIFVRLPGPFNLGHTGVGYEVREMSGSTVTKTYTYCGGVEGKNSLPFISPGQENGGWLNYDLNNNAYMLNRMRAYNYTSYKYETSFRSVPLTWLTYASDIMHYFPYRGYGVAENNCSNAVYNVLAQLDAPGLVQPYYNWAPKDQYNKTVTGWSGSVNL